MSNNGSDSITFWLGLLVGCFVLIVIMAATGTAPRQLNKSLRAEVAEKACKQQGFTDGYWDHDAKMVICRRIEFSEGKQ